MSILPMNKSSSYKTKLKTIFLGLFEFHDSNSNANFIPFDISKGLMFELNSFTWAIHSLTATTSMIQLFSKSILILGDHKRTHNTIYLLCHQNLSDTKPTIGRIACYFITLCHVELPQSSKCILSTCKFRTQCFSLFCGRSFFPPSFFFF